MIKDPVLFVDDDPNILMSFKRQLRKVLPLETALGGEEGLRMVKEKGPFAVVITDMQMPGINGIEFLSRVKMISPESVRMILTGHADIDVTINAVNEGHIFRFLTKPCPPETLGKALVAGIEQYRLITSEKELLENTLNGSINLLTEILSLMDPEAFGRASRLRESVRKVASKLDLNNTWDLELSSLFSQIGYVSVPPETLLKARSGEKLSEKEKEILSEVPRVSQQLLRNIPRLESVSRTVLYHQKRFNGAGVPRDEVAGENIPFGSRFLKILLDLDEFESDGASREDASRMMRQRQGWYDPDLLEQILTHYRWQGEVVFDEVVRQMDEFLSGLRAGDLLLSEIITLDGRFLISKGVRVSEPLLERLRNYARIVGIQGPVMVKRRVELEPEETGS